MIAHFPGVVMPEQYGKRAEDSPYAVFLFWLKLAVVAVLFYFMGILTMQPTLEQIRTVLASFSGGFVGAAVVVFSITTPMFAAMKQISESKQAKNEAEIAELRESIEQNKIESTENRRIIEALQRALADK